MNQADIGGGGGMMGSMMGNGGMMGNGAPYGGDQLVTNINDEEHLRKIQNKTPKNKLIVCDFFATWCGPCNQIKPEVHRFAKLYKDSTVFVKVDVDRNQALAQKYRVRGMPTFVFFCQSNELGRMTGASPRKLEDEVFWICFYVKTFVNLELSEMQIAKHVSTLGGGAYNIGGSSNVNMKPSPYSMFPLARNNRPVYTKVCP